MLTLVINCGSTSTKVALYRDEEQLAIATKALSSEQVSSMKTFSDAVAFRKPSVYEFLTEQGYTADDLDCVVARGGVPGPVQSGAYILDDALLAALAEAGVQNGALNHGNVSGVLAHKIAEEAGIPSYIYDAVSVDELQPVARYSGIKNAPRYSRTHTLNTRAMAIEAASDLGRNYADLNIITAHLGGGNSVNIYSHGRLIDLVTGEEGGFSAERCGGLPGDVMLKLVASEGLDNVSAYFHGKGGLVSYCGTNSALEVEQRAEKGDEEAAHVLDALSYQTAKCIASMAAVVEGNVDLIVLTGGMLHSARIAEEITKRVKFIAPVVVKAGEREMLALARGALRVMRGEEEAKSLSCNK